MKNTYKIKNIDNPLDFIYYSDIGLIEYEYTKAIQKSFIQSFTTNDIDIKNNDYNYKSYIKNTPILLVLKDTKVLGFIVFNYLPNIEALDFNTYLYSKTYIKYLKDITQQGMLVYASIAKDLYPISMYYFNISHKLFFNWLRPVLHVGKMIKIREYYYLCYGPISKEFIEDIILKNYEIEIC